MTDHRVTDLVNGHLGQLSYDVNEEQWLYSRDVNRTQHFEQLLPFQQCIPPSTQDIRKKESESAITTAVQQKWLAKNLPEAFPARSVATNLIKSSEKNATSVHSELGILMAVGGAVDADHISGSRSSFIIAMPCDKAGHVMKLIKPRPVKHGWNTERGVRLSLMDVPGSEQGHWASTGGTILQVVSAGDGNELGTWFAVRQATMTTIFRPAYRKVPKPFKTPLSLPIKYPPSCLDANPVAVLTPERAGSEDHADVTFNPWYARQFAVVDSTGRWSSWDIEGRQTKRSRMELLPAKKGHIYDDFSPDFLDLTSKLPGNVGPWHRVLWAGSVSTIVIMNRRHLAVFDTKSKPVRLSSTSFTKATVNDWILDAKRSTVNLGHILLLTTTQLFWLEIAPAGEDARDKGVNIILSHRHFRDSTDDTMKLTLSKDEDDLTVFISSSKNPLISSYTFSVEGKSATSFQGSLRLFPTTTQETQEHQAGTYNILPAPYIVPSNPAEGTELDYFEAGVKFYQVWMLTTNLELVSTLWACEKMFSSCKRHIGRPLVAPTTKSKYKSIRTHNKRVIEDFIVSDTSDDDLPLEHLSWVTLRRSRKNHKSTSNDLHLRINMRPVFERIFSKQDSGDPQQLNMESALRDVSIRVHDGKQADSLPLATCHELSNMASPIGDLDETSTILDAFLEYIHEENQDDHTLKLHLSQLISCPGISFSGDLLSEDASPSLLLKIYDHLIDIWVTDLPRQTSGVVRLAKARNIQAIAMELWLSSVGLSLRNTALEPSVPQTVEEIPSSHIAKDIDNISRGSSPPFFSSQLPMHAVDDPQFTLPTPDRTPSVYSHASAANVDPTDDLAMSRLRQYAVSLAPTTDHRSTRSSVLSQWPSVPGADPATYSWEEAKKAAAAAEESGDEDRQSQRERARRRKRTERFLDRERAKAAPSSSQPTSIPYGSQPIANNLYSSQPIIDLPMTQPDRGLFGGRVAAVSTPGKKKPKKRRTAGFK